MANTAVTKKPVKSSIAGDTKIWERLKAWAYKNRYFIYAFFIPAIIMAIAYGMFDVYPLAYLFGKKGTGWFSIGFRLKRSVCLLF